MNRFVILLPFIYFTSLTGCHLKSTGRTSSTESTSNSSGNNYYEQCSQVLAQGIYDDVNFSHNIDYQTFAIHQACNELSNLDMNNSAGWDKDCNSTSDSGGLSIGLPIDGIPLNIGANGSDARSSCKDAGSRSSYRKAWYTHYCTNSQSGTSLKDETKNVLRQVNQGIVSAWQTCVTTHQYGLTCAVYKGLDSSTLAVSLAYSPAPQASSSIDLDFTYNNAAPKATLPTSMGHGNRAVLFTVPDASAGTDLIVTGRGLSSSAGQESCTLQLEAFEEKVCDGTGALVGTHSGKIFMTNAAVCHKTMADTCEIGRLKAWVRGNLDQLSGGHADQLYAQMRRQNYTVFWRDNGIMDSVGPCL